MLPGWLRPTTTSQLGQPATVLWPSAPVGDPAARGDPHSRDYVPLPSNRDPRLLLPVGNRHVAARALHLFATRSGIYSRLRTTTVSTAFGLGAGALLPGRMRLHTGVEHAMSEALGQELLLAVHLGPRRANRKPVLALLSPCGRAVGFGKLGIDGLTDDLVHAETTVLRRLATAELADITVPQVLHVGEWNGHPLLVQEALPVCAQTGIPSRGQVLWCAAQIANLAGITQLPLRTSPYLDRLHQRVAALESGSQAAALSQALASLPEVSLPFGSWHGDFTRWNVACTPRRSFVWDWERFAPDVPVGFDVLHFELTEHVRHDAPGGVLRWLDGAPQLLDDARLARLGLAAQHARVVMLLYLVELATRYLHDGQANAGGRLGHLDRWLLPALARLSEPTALFPR